MDIIEEQVLAYNARDIERFIACYAPTIIIEDGDGNVLMRGQETMREMYGSWFATSPQLHCHIVNRIRVGKYVIDEEKVTGLNAEGFPSELHGAAVYRVEGDKIVHMRMYM